MALKSNPGGTAPLLSYTHLILRSQRHVGDAAKKEELFFTFGGHVLPYYTTCLKYIASQPKLPPTILIGPHHNSSSITHPGHTPHITNLCQCI